MNQYWWGLWNKKTRKWKTGFVNLPLLFDTREDAREARINGTGLQVKKVQLTLWRPETIFKDVLEDMKKTYSPNKIKELSERAQLFFSPVAPFWGHGDLSKD